MGALVGRAKVLAVALALAAAGVAGAATPKAAQAHDADGWYDGRDRGYDLCLWSNDHYSGWQLLGCGVWGLSGNYGNVGAPFTYTDFGTGDIYVYSPVTGQWYGPV